MLKAGRFDFAVTDPKVINFIKGSDQSTQLETIKVFTKRPLVLAIKKELLDNDKFKQI